MNKSEQLIACLEGEIAKRDARILELDKKYGWALSELAAIKAQEPVAYISGCYRDVIDGKSDRTPLGAELAFVNMGWIGQIPLYAAPVSEAKAQGVVMPEPDIKTGHGYPAYSVAAVTELFARLNAAPVQQVSVPDEMRSLAQRLREYNQNPHHINPMSEAFHILVADAANALSTACVPKEIASAITWSEHLLFECGALVQTRAPSVHVYNKTFEAVQAAKAMLAAAPAAPAADAGLIDMYRHLQTVTPYRFKKIQDASITDGGDVMYFHKDRFDAALLADMAAHRAKGVV